MENGKLETPVSRQMLAITEGRADRSSQRGRASTREVLHRDAGNENFGSENVCLSGSSKEEAGKNSKELN